MGDLASLLWACGKNKNHTPQPGRKGNTDQGHTVSLRTRTLNLLLLNLKIAVTKYLTVPTPTFVAEVQLGAQGGHITSGGGVCLSLCSLPLDPLPSTWPVDGPQWKRMCLILLGLEVPGWGGTPGGAPPSLRRRGNGRGIYL